MDTKVCFRCKKELPATTEFFWRDKKKKDNLNVVCRTCYNTGYKIEKRVAKEGYKICTICGEELPATADYFHRCHRSDRSNKNTYGLYAKCKKCAIEFTHTERQKELRAKWYDENREKVNDRCKEYYREHIEEAQEFHKRYSSLAKFKVQTRVNGIKRSYGIGEEDVRRLMDDQQGCCCICNSSLITPTSKFEYSIDHCHTTGKVRGLLCNSCNLAIGLLKESTVNLENAIAYLEKHNG